MEAETVLELVYLAIIVAIMVAAFYALWLVMEMSKTCWWNFEECPIKPWAESLLNQTFSKVGE